MHRLDLSGDSKAVAWRLVEQFLPTTDEPNPGADYYRGLSTEACRVLLDAMTASGAPVTQELLAEHLASHDQMERLLVTLQPGEAQEHLRLFLEQFRGADGDKKFRELLGPMSARLSASGDEVEHTIILAPTRTGMSFSAIDSLPRVPQSIIDAIVAYGDARADQNAELGGARLATCIHALRKYVHDAKSEKSFPPPASIS